mmetsp:Transcript_18932/g.64162  ORF Transcript_18932/g.64162 Transcript_18932/m.64162 type:complete len:370 (-) Transcript_18932:702-1811(-)
MRPRGVQFERGDCLPLPLPCGLPFLRGHHHLGDRPPPPQAREELAARLRDPLHLRRLRAQPHHLAPARGDVRRNLCLARVDALAHGDAHVRVALQQDAPRARALQQPAAAEAQIGGARGAAERTHTAQRGRRAVAALDGHRPAPGGAPAPWAAAVLRGQGALRRVHHERRLRGGFRGLQVLPPSGGCVPCPALLERQRRVLRGQEHWPRHLQRDLRGRAGGNPRVQPDHGPRDERGAHCHWALPQRECVGCPRHVAQDVLRAQGPHHAPHLPRRPQLRCHAGADQERRQGPAPRQRPRDARQEVPAVERRPPILRTGRPRGGRGHRGRTHQLRHGGPRRPLDEQPHALPGGAQRCGHRRRGCQRHPARG